MTPCAAGEFCKNPYLNLLNKSCCKCHRALHESCTWIVNSSGSPANQHSTVEEQQEQPICPSCWTFEVSNNNTNSQSQQPPQQQGVGGVYVSSNNQYPSVSPLPATQPGHLHPKGTASSSKPGNMLSTKTPKFGGEKRKKEEQDDFFPHEHDEDESMNVGEGDDTEEEEGDGRTKLELKKKRFKTTAATDTKEAALNMAAIRSTLQKPREENKLSTTAFIVDGLDITQKHALWENENRILTPFNRNSAWWIPFHQGTVLDNDSNGTLKAIGVCNICGNILQLGARSGTSSLTRHLASKHPPVHNAILEALKEGMVLSKYYEEPGMEDSGNGRLDWKPSPRIVVTKGEYLDASKKQKIPPATTARLQKEHAASVVAAKCLNAHVIYAADRNRPFDEFDDPSFHMLRHMIAETALACTRGRTNQTMAIMYQFGSESIRNRAKSMSIEIQEKVAFMIQDSKAPLVGALHRWRGRPRHSSDDPKLYHAFIIHWIQDFKRVSCVVAVDMESDSCIADWKTKLLLWKMGTTPENSPSFIVTDACDDTGEVSIGCLDRKLQMVADVAFKAYLELGDNGMGAETLVAAQRICVYFDENEVAREELKSRQTTLKPDKTPGLLLDIGTQWWSSLAMIERFIEHREALEAYGQEIGVPLPMLSEAEWNTLICLQIVLSPMGEATKYLADGPNVTASLVPVLFYEIREQLQIASQQESVFPDAIAPSQVSLQMLEKLNELTGNFTVDPFGNQNGLEEAYILAHALDPRFKKLKIFEKNTRETIWGRLLAEMANLRPPSEVKAKEEHNNESNMNRADEGRASLGAYAALDSSDSENEDKGDAFQDTWKASCEIELSGFKLEKGTKLGTPSDPDCLTWWSERVGRFPTVWKLCQIYFAIPATATPAERAFKPSGNLTTFNRCTLSTSAKEDDLHCIHENKWVLSAEVNLPTKKDFAPKPSAAFPLPLKQEEDKTWM